MVIKSKGARKRTRKKFRGPKKFTVNDYLRRFSSGQRVVIAVNSSSRSTPFRRFQGKTGEVIGKRGRAYIVKINDGSKEKQVIATPEHLKLVS